ncbi:DUF3306 domain-containing protein [Pseudaminobacter sp. 19-2017]|uniref:DUF3306 domain-containing protein n=1 Tax=Pseudaminobacter soli (ex Zhang et al. 2022) TaxID=2831468 RepID=A0A942DVN5_9HYPH|nr:DUF3306 domain-containing protein [Pseudaminobacter soli]MBS3647641.1 DUF3306 domain-containing protein [Pseudaminobacter soli]
MSGGNDSFLARWSRRKLAPQTSEAQAPEEREHPLDEAATESDANVLIPRSNIPEPEAPETEAAEPAEPLPRIEDLTAESDLSAFLRKGVPLALRSAAMRKMWSLDPGIRDYVGPAEYAWDFNQPGSMAGFGPLDAKETVVGFLSRTARAIGTDTEESAEFARTQPSDDVPPEQASVASDGVADPDPAEISPTTEPIASRPPDASPDATAAASGETEPATPSQFSDPDKPSQAPEPLTRPRHGGAMPR